MGEFFKQLIAQLSSIWEKLSLQQRIIISALVGFMFFGLFGLIAWSGGSGSGSGSSSGMRQLVANLSPAEMSEVDENLRQGNFDYEFRFDGTSVFVANDDYHQALMALASEGLPASSGVGYELFNSVDLGATDFEQRIKLQRAIEGELIRTIESLNEIEAARIHIVMPEESIFLEEQRPAKASLTIKIRAGRNLAEDQIRGISHLVANSIESLTPDNVTIIDQFGKLITNPHGNDPTALASSRNNEILANVEFNLKRKVEELLSRVVGRNHTVQITADLDFDQIEQTIERFDPESKVVRSEERDETSVTNAPDGDRTNERSLSNYEIDRTVEQVIREVGNVKSLSVAVAVDGSYTTDEEGNRTFVPRTQEQIASYEALVKSAVGYDLARGDNVIVVGVQFDEQGDLFAAELNEELEQTNMVEQGIQIGVLILVLIVAAVIVRTLGKSMVAAMNPPLPEVEIPNIIEDEEHVVELPKNVARSNELLERVEIMTEADPNNVARIIKDWLNDSVAKKE